MHTQSKLAATISAVYELGIEHHPPRVGLPSVQSWRSVGLELN